MPLTPPNLDDRSFDDLVNAALDQIKRELNTDWTDLSPGDPGIVLLEAFAFLTEQMIYRLNRLPEKAFVAFLRLLGVSLYPPTAARVQLHFWHDQVTTKPTVIPEGTAVTLEEYQNRENVPVFLTVAKTEIPATTQADLALDEKTRLGNTRKSVLAVHCERVEEVVGVSSGKANQVFQVRKPPIVAPMGSWIDLKVGVQVTKDEKKRAIKGGAKEEDFKTDSEKNLYRLWKEVANFSGYSEKDPVYTVDRAAGTIQFAPAVRKKWKESEGGGKKAAGVAGVQSDDTDIHLMGQVPAKDAAIRVWYPHGGGEAGNVPPGRLTILQGPTSLFDDKGLPVRVALRVTNPEAARGGLPAESLSNALARGPEDLYTLTGLVRANDYERQVLQSARANIARARALAKAEQWRFAQPGTVSVSLVPQFAVESLPVKKRTLLEQAQYLDQAENQLWRRDLESALADKSVLGTRAELRWARYKEVQIEAELIIATNSEGEASEIKKQVETRLNALISPLPVGAELKDLQDDQSGAKLRMERIYQFGWPFGQAISLADVYRWIQNTHDSISLVTCLQINLRYAPDKVVRALAADHFQPSTWYAGSRGRLFRSINDGEGWELLEFPSSGGAKIKDICPNPHVAGVVAVATVLNQPPSPGDGSAIAGVTTAAGLRSELFISLDCGESWQRLRFMEALVIEDMAWLQRGGGEAAPVLLLATSKGLRQVDLEIRAGKLVERDNAVSPPIPVRQGPADKEYPLYAITVLNGKGAKTRVAVAAQNRGGVYLSKGADLIGESQPFMRLRMENKSLPQLEPDIRCLESKMIKGSVQLWAGAMAVSDFAPGCYVWRFSDNLALDGVAHDWVRDGWVRGKINKPIGTLRDGAPVAGRAEKMVDRPEDVAGSCYKLAFLGDQLLALTANWGVMVLDATRNQQQWRRYGPQTGDAALPDETWLSLATNPAVDGQTPILMVGGARAIYRSRSTDALFEKVSRRQFRSLRDKVTLPRDWLLVSSRHKIVVRLEGQFNAQLLGGGEKAG